MRGSAMIPNRRRVYALETYTIERKAKGWFYKKTYANDEWHGPYSSEFSVCLMVADSFGESSSSEMASQLNQGCHPSRLPRTMLEPKSA